MVQILDGKVVSAALQEELAAQVQAKYPDGNKYIAIIYLGDNKGSKTYVAKKKKFGDQIGLKVEVFGQGEEYLSEDETLQFYQKQDYDNVPKVVELVQYLNFDKDCLAIIVQLPLPEQFEASKAQILGAIQPHKDVDGLWGVVQGLSQIGLIDFVPATPRAVIEVLKYYKYDDFQGKTVAILWQSNLIGKPLANELMKQWATVFTANHSSDTEKVKKICQMSDIIISATGVIHLVDESYLSPKGDQIIVDVGYGYIDGKPVGDVQLDKIKDKVAAYTPVPGGVGPVSVASIFKNVFNLQNK